MKEDLRRMTLEQQLRRIRRYVKVRAVQGHRDYCQDPYVDEAAIKRKFRCICPAGLWSIYCNREDAKRREFEARTLAVFRQAYPPGVWFAPATARARAVMDGQKRQGLAAKRRVRVTGTQAKRVEYTFL